MSTHSRKINFGIVPNPFCLHIGNLKDGEKTTLLMKVFEIFFAVLPLNIQWRNTILLHVFFLLLLREITVKYQKEKRAVASKQNHKRQLFFVYRK